MTFGDQIAGVSWYTWVAVALVLLAQGTWLFLDARKRGAHPWLWGLLGLIQCPCPLIYYYFFVIKKPKR